MNNEDSNPQSLQVLEQSVQLPQNNSFFQKNKFILIIVASLLLIGTAFLGVYIFYKSQATVSLGNKQTEVNKHAETLSTPTPSNSDSTETVKLNKHVYLLEDDGTAAVNGIQFAQITNLFYQKYPDKDIYDFMAVFPAFPPGGNEDFAGLHSTIQNDVRGICEPILKSDKSLWGSEKIQGIQIYPYSNSDYGEWLQNPLQSARLLLEETGHQWLTRVGKRITPAPPGNPPDGLNRSCLDTTILLHDSDDLHWSSGLQTPPGSVGAMREAVPWIDKGNGRFSFDTSLYDQPRKFHPFDLYLMGFANPSEVNEEFLLLTNITDTSNSAGLQREVSAQARKITINDIIDIAGEERSPDAKNSQKNFKLAFVILYKNGQQPSETLIKAITAGANNFPNQWAYATNYKSRINED